MGLFRPLNELSLKTMVNARNRADELKDKANASGDTEAAEEYNTKRKIFQKGVSHRLGNGKRTMHGLEQKPISQRNSRRFRNESAESLLDEMTDKVYDKAYDKAMDRFGKTGEPKHLMQGEKFYSGALFNRHKKANPSLQMKDRKHMFDDTLYLKSNLKKMSESTASFLGLTDEDIKVLEEIL